MQEADVEAGDTISRRVLVVEPDGTLRILIAAALRSTVEVDLAVNGSEALRRIHACAYAVILLDLIAPAIDGLTFLREMRTRYPERKTIVLAITTADSDRALLPDDVDAIVRKPFNLTTLHETILGAVDLLSARYEESDSCPPADVAAG